MGYITTYRLDVIKGNSDKINEFVSAYEDASYALTPYGDNNESCSWYKHESQLREFSKTCPDVLFCLSGEWEEYPDMWRKYFQNGFMQRCNAIIEYPPFDESLLK